MTVILGAMEGEIEAIRSGLEASVQSDWRGFTIIRGSISGEPVALCRTGVGKTLSAMVCQHLIETIHPDRVIFTGVAGSINPDLQIGDVVVGRDALHHDMDATALGLERGAIPFSDFRIIPCDPGLVRIASDLTPPRGSCRVGRVLTGDQFIVSPATRRKLREEFGGDCVEMEGASVALVCAVNEVGCVLIRTISDHADGTVDFSRAIAVAAENAYHYVRGILAAI